MSPAPALKEAVVTNGTIVFRRAVPSKAESTETTHQNGVTVNVHSQAVAELPSHYEVVFAVNSMFEQDGIETANFFSLSTCILETSDHAPYREIEDKGARQIAPMLRALADTIEADLPSCDADETTIGARPSS